MSEEASVPDGGEEEFSVVRGGYEYEVNWATVGFPLVNWEPPDLVWFLFVMVYQGVEIVLSRVLPIKVGVVRQKVGRPGWPRVVYKERLPPRTHPAERMAVLLDWVEQGKFDVD